MTNPITYSPSPRLTVRRTHLIRCGTTRRFHTGALTTCSTARARNLVTSTTFILTGQRLWNIRGQSLDGRWPVDRRRHFQIHWRRWSVPRHHGRWHVQDRDKIGDRGRSHVDRCLRTGQSPGGRITTKAFGRSRFAVKRKNHQPGAEAAPCTSTWFRQESSECAGK